MCMFDIMYMFDISKREWEVYNLIILGKTHKEIADILYISPLTVKNHITHLYSKTKAQNRAELIHFYYKNKEGIM